MNEILIAALTERRLAAGSNGQPLGYDKFAKLISAGQMHGPTLFRFIKGEENLKVGFIRLVASWARANNDTDLIRALILYALG